MRRQPEWLWQARCLCCGAPVRIRNLSDRQSDRWCEFFSSSDLYDYEGFDAWLPLDNYRVPKQAVPVGGDHFGRGVMTA